MAATYRAVMLTKRGGPEVLQVVELPVETPGHGQLRIRVRAAGVGATDLTMLGGNYMFAPKIPFVPGYEVAGVVEAIGAGVTGFELGQRVGALTVYGAFAELLVREAEHFLPIPEGVSDRDAAAVILSYVTAWQIIHRVAKVQRGQTALVTAAAGGVGTAGPAIITSRGEVKSVRRGVTFQHALLRSLGATPIDYRAGALDRLVRALEPKGVDYAFDAIGGANIGACIGALRKGGTVVGFGFMAAEGMLAKAAMFGNLLWGRGCAAGEATSTVFPHSTGKTPSRCERICPLYLPSSKRIESTHSSPTPSRSWKHERPWNSWRQALCKAKSSSRVNEF